MAVVCDATLSLALNQTIWDLWVESCYLFLGEIKKLLAKMLNSNHFTKVDSN